MDHARVASDVLKAVGGANNIAAAAHCATRLRLVLNDYDVVDEAALNNDPDIKGIFTAGGMFQIIVGPGDVNTVYGHLINDHGVKEVSKDEAKQVAAERENAFTRFIKMIADIFVPILPALVAGGLMMAINNILTADGLFGEGTDSIVTQFPAVADYASVINMISSAAFASLPVLVGFSAAKRWGGNVYLGASIGAAMISSSLLNAWNIGAAQAGEAEVTYWHLFGLDVAQIGYQAQVIPTLAVTFVMCLIEKRFRKWLSGTADFLLTPLFTLLITGFLAFVLIGPATRLLATWITDGLQWIYMHLGPVGGALFGLVYSPIVVTGLHQSFPAVELPLIADMANTGGSFIFPIASMANVAQGAACLAVFFLARDAKIKGIAGASGVSAIFGITEPAIFGVNLRLRWPFFIGIIAAAIGGAGVAIFNVRAQALGAAGFVGFVSIRTTDIPVYLVLEVLVFLIAFAGTFIYAKTRGAASIAGEETAAAAAILADDPAHDDYTVTAPIEGQALALSQVKDQTFASGMLGPGLAIDPTGGPVVSPVDGEVIVAFPTGHAYGIRSISGVELLIHVGMDTVELDGKHFTPQVKVGDQVKRGDTLVDVDWEAIKAAGYEIVTPMVVSNAAAYAEVEEKASGSVVRGDLALIVEPAEAAAVTA